MVKSFSALLFVLEISFRPHHFVLIHGECNMEFYIAKIILLTSTSKKKPTKKKRKEEKKNGMATAFNNSIYILQMKVMA